MSLRSKILAVMAVPVIVLGIATGALLRARQQTTEALVSERNAVAVRDSLDHILVDLTDAETGSRGYILSGEASFLEPYTQGAAALRHDIQTLTGLMGDNRVAVAEIAQLRVLVNQRLSLLQTIQLLAPVTDLTNHSQLVSEMSRGKVVMDQIRALVAREESEAASLLEQRERGLDASRNVSFLVGIIGMPLGVLASLVVVMLFIQRLARRIVRTEEIAHMLDEGMPLGEPSTSDDELGRLERVLVRSGNRLVQLQTELRLMGTSDALTRLMNRRGFLPSAEHQLEIAKRTCNPMAFMFLDLDGLKHVNDTLGHSAGDGMITECAFVLRETFRASDLIARMGGDEFCVLFAIESESSAITALSRLKATVDRANVGEGRPFDLSFSTGVAIFDPEDPCTLDELMARADREMYAAKRAKLRERTADTVPS